MAIAPANNFSARFHILCDQTGFVKGRGRAAEVSRFFDVSQTTVRNWLIESFCPRDQTLQKIISRLRRYDRLSDSISPKALQLWLEKGDSYIPNPFQASHESPVSPDYDFLALYKVYGLITQVAEDAGVEITDLPCDIANSLLYELSTQNIETIHRSRAKKLIREKLKSVVLDR